MNRHALSVMAAVLAAAVCVNLAQAFTPARTFPDTWSRINVFVDQLNSLSAQQAQFAGSHYAGTQKQTSPLIDAVRVYNPNFIMIQYRLGTRDSGDTVSFIHNNTWTSDWAAVTANDYFFLKDNLGQRIAMNVSGHYEWVMDAAGIVNAAARGSNPAWSDWWSNAVIADINSSHGDGVFADSTHLPYGTIYNASGTATTNTHIGSAPYIAYSDDLEAFYSTVYANFNAANKYFIPNIGGLCTTADPTTGYYSNVHGAMVEGAFTQTSDWVMQQNRTLNLIRNDKIFIAQPSVSSNGDTAGRMWDTGNFLLLKDHHSFLNIVGASSSQCYWLPEYDIPLGAPATSTIPSNITNLRVTAGVDLYRRYYERGLVLVNASTTAKTYTFAASDARFSVTAAGGGDINSAGVWTTPGTLTYTKLAGTTVSVPAWRSIILTHCPADANLDGTVDGKDYTIWADHYNQSVTAATDGDFSGDGKVDSKDLDLFKLFYGNVGGSSVTIDAPLNLPEPASMMLLLAGAAMLRRRK